MNDSKLEVDEFGIKRWRNKKGQLHRENGPAVIWSDGSLHWYRNGVGYRIDGPAIIGMITKSWCIKGKNVRNFSFDKV